MVLPMQTLPDYLASNLAVISIGLNPSLPSVRDGFYFANPRNRFWKALNASELIKAELIPGVAAMDSLFNDYAIGFTDVVKRPTAGGSDLRAADFREWSPVLKEKLLRYKPRLIWFHGKQAWLNYLKYAEDTRATCDWGAQSFQIGETPVFVTPNTSPANAVYSLDDLVGWFNALKQFRDNL